MTRPDWFRLTDAYRSRVGAEQALPLYGWASMLQQQHDPLDSGRFLSIRKNRMMRAIFAANREAREAPIEQWRDAVRLALRQIDDEAARSAHHRPEP